MLMDHESVKREYNWLYSTDFKNVKIFMGGFEGALSNETIGKAWDGTLKAQINMLYRNVSLRAS